MTPDELAAIEARANAATPGPWTEHADGSLPPDPRKIRYVRAPNGAAIASFLRTQGLDPHEALMNGVFIAAARTDVPALVAEVRRLRDQLEAMPKPQCRCGSAGELPHGCPYQQEINNNEALCSCCDKCRHECAMDI